MLRSDAGRIRHALRWSKSGPRPGSQRQTRRWDRWVEGRRRQRSGEETPGLAYLNGARKKRGGSREAERMRRRYERKKREGRGRVVKG